MRLRRHLRFVVVLLSAAILSAGLTVLSKDSSSLIAATAGFAVLASWLMVAILALRPRRRKDSSAVAIRRDMSAARNLIIDNIVETRRKQSRHEYHQEQSLGNIEKMLTEVRLLLSKDLTTRFSREQQLDFLFVTSNGAGLGHISRLMAVARQFENPERCRFLTLSTAYRRVAGREFNFYYYPSADTAGILPQKWNKAFRNYFWNLVLELRPRVVVFDGTWVYSGITEVCRTLDITLVWMQRGLWKHEVNAKSAQRHNAVEYVDRVIVPGDFAGAEVVESGKGITPHYVGPIVLTEREQSIPREEACNALGLDPARTYVLLNLGGGSLTDPSQMASQIARSLEEAESNLTPVQLASPLASDRESPPGMIRVSAYPVMKYARAFDAMIAAAGYNSAQEAVLHQIPTVLVPNARTKTDDQVRRARLLSELGACLKAESLEELTKAVRALTDEDVRGALAKRSGELGPADGAAESAHALEAILSESRWHDRRDVVLAEGLVDELGSSDV